ncbi:MAG: DUF4118 domain-containing protein [bacterium]|nr:DUF4118 domain-containing protein [bacterium]
MANAFQGSLTAIYVETSEDSYMYEKNRKRLNENIKEAEKLGAAIETVYGDDIAFQIAEFAKLCGASKIVLGKSAMKRRIIFGNGSLIEQLVQYDPELEIYSIPDYRTHTVYRKKNTWRYYIPRLTIRDIILSLTLLIIATLIGFFFEYCGYSQANIIMIYIIGVLMNSIVTTWPGYSLIASFVSVLVFNFLFTEPRFTLLAYDKDYPITFLVMFLVAFLASYLTIRLKEHARKSARAAYRTKILFDTNQLLEQVRNRDEIIEVTARQIAKLLKRNLIVYQVENDTLSKPKEYLQEGEPAGEKLFEEEKEIAFWVMKNSKHAGATTEVSPDAKCLYLAIRMEKIVYGVVGIEIDHNPIDVFEHSILLAILGECSLALENDRNRKEKEEVALLAEKEQLRANLLRAISHDLRTPLTSISGNASNLIKNDTYFDEDTKMRIYTDIYEDSIWLIKLVENLLSVTRIEDGKMNIHMTAEVVDEVIQEAVRHVNSLKKQHRIRVINSKDLLLAFMDSKLIIQVLINLIDNAIKYTPIDSEIVITSRRKGQWIEIVVLDNGEGIPDEIKEHIFEMFYTGENHIADGRRSLGLGLALCKLIVELHGGKIIVTDNKPKGAIFRFELKAYDPKLSEEMEV